MIYIIITTSINNKVGINNSIHRKQRYIESIQQLLNLVQDDNEIKPIIVENNGFRETYLNQFNCDILYTNNNRYNFINKADNELLDIKQVINHYNINDDDFIIKLTGRYKLLNLDFLKLIKNNMNNYDAFVKFFNVSSKQYLYDDCVLGLFCIKCKYLKYFNYSSIKSPECEFAIFLRKNIEQNKLMEINHLNLECCFAGDLSMLIV